MTYEALAKLTQTSGFTQSILMQTCGDIEDGFDFEAMMELEAEHSAHFIQMYAALRAIGEPVLPIGTDGCRQCRPCTYPDAP